MARAAQGVPDEVRRLRRDIEEHNRRYHVLDDESASRAISSPW